VNTNQQWLRGQVRIQCSLQNSQTAQNATIKHTIHTCWSIENFYTATTKLWDLSKAYNR